MVAVQAKIEKGEGERLSFYKGRKLTLALVFSFKRESDRVSALKANLFSDFQHWVQISEMFGLQAAVLLESWNVQVLNDNSVLLNLTWNDDFSQASEELHEFSEAQGSVFHLNRVWVFPKLFVEVTSSNELILAQMSFVRVNFERNFEDMFISLSISSLEN